MTAPPATAPAPARTRRRSWRQFSVTLPADRPDLIAPIRRLAAGNSTAWGARAETAHDLAVCASELLTNAQLHSHGPARLELTVHDGALLLKVSDTNTAHPRELDPGTRLLDEHGKGLLIVGALADAVDVRLHAWGKTVTARFSLA